MLAPAVACRTWNVCRFSARPVGDAAAAVTPKSSQSCIQARSWARSSSLKSPACWSWKQAASAGVEMARSRELATAATFSTVIGVWAVRASWSWWPMIMLPVPIASMGAVSMETPLQCTRVRVAKAIRIFDWLVTVSSRISPGPSSVAVAGSRCRLARC